MEFYVAIWGISAVLAMLIGAAVAYAKRLDMSAWAAWCFFFPPALIILLLRDKNTGERRRKPSLDDDDYARD